MNEHASCYDTSHLYIASAPSTSTTQILSLLCPPALRVVRSSLRDLSPPANHVVARPRRQPTWTKKVPQQTQKVVHASCGTNHTQNDSLSGWRTMLKTVKGYFQTRHKMQRRKNVVLALPRVGSTAFISKSPTMSSQLMKMQRSRMM